jgi:uncharacterized protein (TIGR02246 family)
MSVNEIQTLAQRFADAFDRLDVKAVLEMLADDVEVIDHVPYRFDDKASFAKYLSKAVEAIVPVSFDFRQPSCRVYNNDSVGIVNAYDTFLGVSKDGKAVTLHGRTTLVFVRQGGQWKIVSCHFSPMPQAA